MKTKVFTLALAVAGCMVCNAQITKEEYGRLSPEKQRIYTSQQKEIDKKRKQENEKHEDRNKWAREMQYSDAKGAGAAHQIIEERRHEKAVKEIDKHQKLLDNAAREGLKNSSKK